MVDLAADDLRRALDFVGALYEDIDDVAIASETLAILGDLVGCDLVSATSMDHTDRRVLESTIDRTERESLLDRQGFAEAVSEHPGFGAYRSGALRLGTSVALTDLAAPSVLRRFQFYVDFYRPEGTADQLVCAIRSTGRLGTVITFNRDRYGFSDRDRAVVDLIAPHVSSALAVRERIAALRAPDVDLADCTPREREVIALVASGATDREVARALSISPRTVHKHLERIYRKFDVTSRTSLIARLTS
ncbi:helix-turn-helix transcriptional regulator [Kibdelosporangium aridum]|uniref:helix-turn-helix transcriptional regulator n=1 Tax=Kibdelosporangium aridum TaxID=2030 RepID=UPI00068AC1F0